MPATSGLVRAVRRYVGEPGAVAEVTGVPRWHELTLLADDSGGPRLSIFLPLRWGGTQHTKTRIRAKNLLRRAMQALRAEGMRPADADRLVDAAQRVVDDVLAFQPSAAGLALFAGPDGVRHLEVPERLPELVVLHDRFVVGPLLAQRGTDGTFFVLALNQDEIRVFEGARHRLDEVELSGHALAAWSTMPSPGTTQVHSFLADHGGVGARAVFHGVGAGGADDRKALLVRHFRGVDRELRDVLRETQAPLVVAAVRNMRALYDEVNTYPHLLDEGIDGSPRDLSIEQLHRRAWAIVEPALLRDEQTAVDRYLHLRGTPRAVEEPAAVCAAAGHGQVETLLIDADACTWRTAGEAGDVVRLPRQVRPLLELEQAALATKRNGGAVFVVPAERMPVDASACAVLRYAATKPSDVVVPTPPTAEEP